MSNDLERYDREIGQWLDDSTGRVAPPEIPISIDGEPNHPGWAALKLGVFEGTHLVRWGEQVNWRTMTVECLAGSEGKCHYQCPADCDYFPCQHEPTLGPCLIIPFTDGIGDDAFYEESIEKHGHVNALVDAEWESESYLLSYTENALGEVRSA